MRDLELLREQYREVVGTVIGASQRLSRVFTRHDVDPQVAARILALPLETTGKTPIQDPMTGQLYCRAGVPGLEPINAGVT